MKKLILMGLAMGMALTGLSADDAAKSDVAPSGNMQIDLAMALKLANARNVQIAIAKERVKEATAQLRQKQYLLIPDVNIGASWHRQDGPLQATGGAVQDVRRTSTYLGVGAGALGAGSTMRPGLSISANLADVVFAPLAARQNREAMKAASEAVNNTVLLQVVEAYFELVRASANVGVAAESLRNTKELAKITGDFASSGEGLQSDSQRAQVEALIRSSEVEQAKEGFHIAVANLAALLHLELGVQLSPSASNPVAVDLFDGKQSLTDLVAQALENRPESKQYSALVREAKHQLTQAKIGPFVPNVAVGVSQGSFAGNTGSSAGNSDSRTDVNAMVYWSWDSFGLGSHQRVRERRAGLEVAKHSQTGAMDGIIVEVRHAHAQVDSRRRQIRIAEQAVKSAKASFELNRARIFEKQGLPIEVMQAIKSLAVARQLHVNTVTDFNRAQFRLLAAVGQAVVGGE
ncbi:TolC family protein [Verrucomicrobia bacterium]|nr:TolC family protein [Verrucomicrobiota bacterium]